MSLENKVEDQIGKNQSLTERIALYIPIYKGYKEKNLRREEDRAVRNEVAKAIERSKLDLATIRRATVNDPGLMRDVERVGSKADRFCIGVKKAVNGYSSFHTAVKIMEPELDALVSWDAELMNDAVALKQETEKLVEKIDAGETNIGAPLRELEKIIDKLIEDYNKRETVMRGFETEK